MGKHVGAVFKELRRLNGYSLQKVADSIDSSKSYMHNIESGKCSPGFGTVCKLITHYARSATMQMTIMRWVVDAKLKEIEEGNKDDN